MKPSQRRTAARALAFLTKVSGLTSLLSGRRRRQHDYRVFILEYHDVSVKSLDWSDAVSQGRFRSHVRLLHSQYPTVTLAEAARALRTGGSLEADLAVVTFDDGYVGNYRYAWPILQELGVPATIYLTTGFLDGEELWFDSARRTLEAVEAVRSGPIDRSILTEAIPGWTSGSDIAESMQRLKYSSVQSRERALRLLSKLDLDRRPPAQPITWDQVRELEQDGVEFGSHTASHPILSMLPADRQEAEITASCRRIVEETGHHPVTFAYPNGSRRDYNQETMRILREQQFLAACATRRGSNRPGCDLLQLRRLGIGDEPYWVVEARLAGLFDEKVRRLLPTGRAA